MKKLLNKAERRFGKYSIQGLMKYIIAIEIAGAVIGILVTTFGLSIKITIASIIGVLIAIIIYRLILAL